VSLHRSCVLALLALFALLLASPRACRAQWSTNPTVNNMVFTGTTANAYPSIVTDGAGGAIFSWFDNRTGVGTSQLCGQRLGTNAAMKWFWTGVVIATASDMPIRPVMIPDGAGGAIVTWDFSTGSSSQVFAQRVDSSGALRWGGSGVLLCTSGGEQTNPTLASDGAGGAIFTWNDWRNSPGTDLYAQRVDRSGSVRWAAGGVPVSTLPQYQTNPNITPDTKGGAFIAWQDSRNELDTDIFAQHLDSTGTSLWTAGGIGVGGGPSDQWAPVIAPDGAGGALIAWQDGRNGVYDDLYAQRLTAAGNALWTVGGEPLSVSPNSKGQIVITGDGAGGLVGAWASFMNFAGTIWAGRIAADGTHPWAANGVPVDTLAGNAQLPVIAPDGAHGAIIAWQDLRSGTKTDIYAQRLNASGVAQWTANGMGVATGIRDKSAVALLEDGVGGVFATWLRSGGLYASHVTAAGALGPLTTGVEDEGEGLPPAFAMSPGVPNPFRPATVLRFDVPGVPPGAAAPVVTLRVYDMQGRVVATLVNGAMTPGTHRVTWTAGDLPSGVYFSRLTAGTYSETRKLVRLQ
jgi:hypothetical protein